MSVMVTLYAPMCCVMPPASPPATFVMRMASSNVVLPWSTWPMMVTTGGRGCNACVSSVVPVWPAMSFAAASSKLMTLVSAPKKRAMSTASSWSSV